MEPESRNRIFSAEYRAQVVSKYQSSGLGQKEFSSQEGISKSALYSWLKQSDSREAEKFVEAPVSCGHQSYAARIELELPPSVVLRIWS